MDKQKILPPSLREGHRYVVYQVRYAKNQNSKLLDNFELTHKDIISQCNSLLGIFDGAGAGLIGAKYNARNHRGIIKTNSKYLDKLRVCLGMIKSIRGEDAILNPVYVSGMLAKAESEMNKKTDT